MRVLKPGKARAEMLGNAERQAVFLRGLLPVGHHVAVRPVVHGVPFVQRRVPQEKIIVMRTHADEVFRARFFVEFHQFFRLPFLGFP